MDILIGLILLFFFLSYQSLQKTEKEDRMIYKKTIDDTSFNTTRSKKK
ncbi:MAG: hypothetical protein OXB84_06755 [Halobacteriovoraceae bacterium]|nr:hypothetical protein [Halobacteriovoraceae bacterium]